MPCFPIETAGTSYCALHHRKAPLGYEQSETQNANPPAQVLSLLLRGVSCWQQTKRKVFRSYLCEAYKFVTANEMATRRSPYQTNPLPRLPLVLTLPLEPPSHSGFTLSTMTWRKGKHDATPTRRSEFKTSEDKRKSNLLGISLCSM